MSAWIEIKDVFDSDVKLTCRTLCECVDWNGCEVNFADIASPSHSLWVRGLKSFWMLAIWVAFKSHSLWVRGLKYLKLERVGPIPGRRTPCECVDWNTKSGLAGIKSLLVALFVSAWIEIVVQNVILKMLKVALFVSAWIEILLNSLFSLTTAVALFVSAWIEIIG